MRSGADYIFSIFQNHNRLEGNCGDFFFKLYCQLFFNCNHVLWHQRRCELIRRAGIFTSCHPFVPISCQHGHGWGWCAPHFVSWNILNGSKTFTAIVWSRKAIRHSSRSLQEGRKVAEIPADREFISLVWKKRKITQWNRLARQQQRTI